MARTQRPGPVGVWARVIRRAAAVALTATAGLLAGCGGDDGGSALPTIGASNDTLTLATGQSAQLLANDTLDAVAALAGSGGNVVFTLTSGALPVGVTVVDGLVSIGASAVPGTVTLSYRICAASSTEVCATAQVTITIPAPTLSVVSDSFTLIAGQSGDVLANDLLGTVLATAATVTVSAEGSLPNGVALSTAGLLTVDAGAASGSYTVDYRVCQSAAPTNCATGSVSLTVPVVGSLTGRVVDAASAQGIAGVTVSVDGQSTTSDANGAYTLSGLALSSRSTVVFQGSGYAQAARITAISAGVTEVQARMVQAGTVGDVDVAAGGSVTMSGSPASVVLGANAVQRADGSLPTGTMRVSMTPIDPATDSSVMPGDFTTQGSSGTESIESFGALAVELTDSNGAALNLRSGQTATIRIPLASRNSIAPATVPLFHFDTTSGRWVQEGTAVLAGSGLGSYYEGTVSHFSTWNADQVINSIRVTGCMADASGNPVVGGTIASDGVDYSGVSTAVTDATGRFSIVIKKLGTVTLTGVFGGLLTNTVRVGPSSTDIDVSSCLALGQAGAGVTMKLTWGAHPSDLDSHLYTPSGSHVYYSSKGSLVSAPFANLDVDDTSSYGPEVVTLTKLMVGTYKYAIYNYSGQSNGLFSASGARVELNLPGRSPELFTVPAAGESASTNWWLLFEFDVDAQCAITVRRSSQLSTTGPTQAATSTPVYCTPP